MISPQPPPQYLWDLHLWSQLRLENIKLNMRLNLNTSLIDLLEVLFQKTNQANRLYLYRACADVFLVILYIIYYSNYSCHIYIVFGMLSNVALSLGTWERIM